MDSKRRSFRFALNRVLIIVAVALLLGGLLLGHWAIVLSNATLL